MSLVGTLDNFPDNSTTSVIIEQRPLLIVRRAGAVFIYENNCPHTRETLDPMGGSIASADGLLVRCQRHAAEFVSETGECVAGPCQGEHLTPVAYTLAASDIYLD